MKNLRQNKAITLIALVITIIVLLILAGVTIASLTGENGLLSRATQAKDKTTEAEVKDEVGLAWNAVQIDGLQQGWTINEKATALATELKINSSDVKVTGNNVEVTYKGYKVTINTVNGSIVAEKSNTDPSSLTIGDVVTNYTSNTALPTGTNWIYFGEDGNGHKLLTTSAPIPNGFILNGTAQNWLYYCMQEGDEDYAAHSSELTENNNIHLACSKYSGTVGTTAGTARSITLEDINRVVGFNESSLQFNNYTFIAGDTNDYANNNVNYYYPSFLGASRSDYPYFVKAGETLNNNTIGTKAFLCNHIIISKNGDDYKASWEGTDKSWGSQKITLLSSQYMPLIVGNVNDFVYAVASRSVAVGADHSDFLVAGVGGGWVFSSMNTLCKSDSGQGGSSGSESSRTVSVRPIIVLPSSVTLETE